ncbi:CobW family GTP-binding protein [Aliamphritea ceti]|uniref:CobW family GTP-binding protein n=1 Tax=Aliamphritea ceti TaxID=1524258 RepID=UPI0021C398C3|nr:GTP-binding protein [Aliamphritea ceti]
MNNQKLQPAIPVCVISGFLGSGKTTLLNHILNGDHGLNITVMVNDFGAINIDSQLLEKQEANTISLSNGCICCSIQNDLVYELQNLLNQPDGPPEYIVIETSGVSDPTKIINTMRYPQLRDRFQIDSVLTLVNAESINEIEGQVKQLAMAQLDAADIILINKVDCISAEMLDGIHKQWLYPSARVIETCYANVPLDILFTGEVKERSVEQGSFLSLRKLSEGPAEAEEQDHSKLFQTWSWRTEEAVCINKLRAVIEQFPNDIYRAKGIVYSRQLADTRLILQMVGNRQEWDRSQGWLGKPHTELVVIGAAGSFDQTEMQASFDACVLPSE